MKLIKDWKNSWKYASTQIAIWGTILASVWYQYPELRQFLPAELIQKYSPIIGLLIIWARITDFTQDPKVKELKKIKKEIKKEMKNN